MYKVMGQKVFYQGRSLRVRGVAPAEKVRCGSGYAVLLIVDGKSQYVNTKELSN